MCHRVTTRRLVLLILGLGLLIGIDQWVNADAIAEHTHDDTPTEESQNVKPESPAALDFTMQTIADEEVHLAKYHGNVVLMVNVASQCGLTGQYKQLQALHATYAERGLSILGFPANNFGKQEPGTNEQILAFCKKNYGVEFDMFAKISVKGDDIAPLYAFLTDEETNPGFEGEISWNFEKFLIDRTGQVVARLSPRTEPDDEAFLKILEAELEKPDPTDEDKKKKANQKNDNEKSSPS